MIQKWIRHYFSIVFIVATLMGSMHHHNDLQVHEDCQICTIVQNLSVSDTPTKVLYLSSIEKCCEVVLTNRQELHSVETFSSLNARAPPIHS